MEAGRRDLEEAKRIILDKLRGVDANVYLFGSWARGEARRHSDIDVAIAAAEPLPAALLLELEEALEASEILYPVDLVDLNAAASTLRQKVLAEGIAWSA